MTETWNPASDSKSQTRDLEVTDIVERLKAHASCGGGCCSDTRRLMNEASDEIMRLRGLINATVEAVNGLQQAGIGEGSVPRFLNAFDALRGEAIRQIT